MNKIVFVLIAFFISLETSLNYGVKQSCNPAATGVSNVSDKPQARKTKVSIVGNQFIINGEPTFKGRFWNGYKIEGLLPNSRMVQGIFDDENPLTVNSFAYSDTKVWDAERNTDEFVAAMPLWAAHGLLSFTVNMQGGSPLGYGNQGWINTAFDYSGNLKPSYMARLEKIFDKADELGMVPILGLFYFGQDEHLKDEEAVINAVKNTVNWIHGKGYENILIEIANECDVDAYDHSIIKPDRAHELINLVKQMGDKHNRLLVSTSFRGDVVPAPNVIRAADYILFHGNGVEKPERIVEIVDSIRSSPEYSSKPIVNNEDDHYDFDQPMNNFIAATSAYASWGYFDYRRKGEAFEEGFQSIPVDWGINSERKKGFFQLVKQITGY